MGSIKMASFTVFLLAEVIACLYLYTHGTHGWHAVQTLKTECAEIKKRSALLIKTNEALQGELDDWAQYPAYREIDARKKLQLAQPDETWYAIAHVDRE
jgi:cell division protein FtsB